MVTLAAGAALSAAGPTWVGGSVFATALVGAGIKFGTAYIDQRFVLPGLLGKPPSVDSDRLLDVPTGAQGVGSSRVVAYGRRVRIPAHIIFQSRKTREDNPSQKAGSQITQRQVFLDLLVAVNSRKTHKFLQLIGNGRILAWTDRNFISYTTVGMSGTTGVSGSARTLTLQAASLQEVSFSTVFAEGDLVTLQGFTGTYPSAQDPNGRTWLVTTVTDHTTSPGVMILKGIDGQLTTGSWTVSGGSNQTPASIIRLDDSLDLFSLTSVTTNANNGLVLRADSPLTLDKARKKFQIGDQVVITGLNPDVSSSIFKVARTTNLTAGVQTMRLDVVSGPGSVGPVLSVGSDSARAIMRLSSAQKAAPGFLPPDYDVAGNFFDGAEDQGEHPLIVAHKGTGNVSAYRGVAIFGMEELNVTQLGGQAPFNMEALIEPDPVKTLGSVLTQILTDNGFERFELNTLGINSEISEGVWNRGATPLRQMIQPLLIGYQILTQESNGVLKFFKLRDATTFALRNETSFSDLGFSSGPAVEKLAFDEEEPDKLPTQVNVRFVDPDSYYVDGFHPFTLRSPSGVGHQKVEDLNLLNVCMRRRQAGDLAANHLRLRWINSRTFQTTLSATWLFLLENDLLEVTDDATSREYTGRIVDLKFTSSWLVEVTCVVEDVDYAVSTSSIESGGQDEDPPVVFSPADLEFAVLDLPPMSDKEINTPSLIVVAGAAEGSRWGGATIFVSTDGESWVESGFVAKQSGLGTTTSTMPPASACEQFESTEIIPDTSTTLSVMMHSLGPTGMATVTEDQILQGQNWFALVDTENNLLEIFGAQTVTHLGGNEYELTNLYRGLRGTAAGCEMVDPVNGDTFSHPIGSRVVSLTDLPTTGVSVPLAGLVKQEAIRFKIVPAGANVEDGYEIDVKTQWRSVRPFPVRDVTKTIFANPYPVRFTVDHWTRRNLPVAALSPYPLDEEYEGYQVDLYRPDGNSIALSKTIQATSRSGTSTLRDKWIEFSAAELLSAGYSPGPATQYVIDVRQTSVFGLGSSFKRVI